VKAAASPSHGEHSETFILRCCAFYPSLNGSQALSDTISSPYMFIVPDASLWSSVEFVQGSVSKPNQAVECDFVLHGGCRHCIIRGTNVWALIVSLWGM
jgi:hypothetical protein